MSYPDKKASLAMNQIRLTHPGSGNATFNLARVTFVSAVTTVYRITLNGQNADYDSTAGATDANILAGLLAAVAALTGTLVSVDDSSGTNIDFVSDDAEVPFLIAVSIVSGAGTISIPLNATMANGNDAGKTAFHIIGVDRPDRLYMNIQVKAGEIGYCNFGAAATVDDFEIPSKGTMEWDTCPIRVLNVYLTNPGKLVAQEGN